MANSTFDWVPLSSLSSFPTTHHSRLAQFPVQTLSWVSPENALHKDASILPPVPMTVNQAPAEFWFRAVPHATDVYTACPTVVPTVVEGANNEVLLEQPTLGSVAGAWVGAGGCVATSHVVETAHVPESIVTPTESHPSIANTFTCAAVQVVVGVISAKKLSTAPHVSLAASSHRILWHIWCPRRESIEVCLCRSSVL